MSIRTLLIHRALAARVALTLAIGMTAACGTTDKAVPVQAGLDAADKDLGGFTIDVSIGTDASADPDAQPTDIVTPPDVPISPDVPPQDTGVCDQAGCPCSDNGQCQSGYCIETSGGSVCAQTCTSICPQGFACKTVTTGGSDVVTLCLSQFPRLCEPCGTDADCQGALGSSTALCVPYGDGKDDNPGSFCGGSCDDKNACPLGYKCSDVKNSSGATVKQCKKEDLQCECDTRARKLGLTTTCGSSNAFGACNGKRSCTDSGLGACSAPPAAPETCNGLDDNCDGKTDDIACDDKNPCTIDTCDASAKACAHSPIVGPCDDGSKCTSGDTCVNGQCTGKAKNCDDGNACTDDTCDAAGGCKYEYATGPCSDDACKTGQTCVDGQCQGGKVKSCNDNNPCTADSCDDTGCQHKPLTGGCDDGNACTQGDSCATGTCAGTAKSCDDGNPCTDDTCDSGATGGCKNTPTAGTCDDGSKCTQNDGCTNGSCAGKAVPCDDSNPCTTDSCDPQNGCAHQAQAGACNDGDPCTSGEKCSADGVCAGGLAVDCDDKNPCTADTCDISSGACKNVAAPAKCDDSNSCTQNDFCQNGQCVGQTGGCDDSNPCTTDVCDGVKGCVHSNSAAACDDGNPCTTSDTCSAGSCVGGVAPKCDDGNACTNDGCDAKTGCTHAANTAVCDDGDPCSSGDKCNAGKCSGGANVCGCSTQADCDAQPNPNVCLGKLICDTAKFPYKCVADSKTAVTCDTSTDTGCKTTACDAKTGKCAVTTISDNSPCTDGNACTTGDTCTGGVCKPSGQADCDDKNQCTSDSCDKVSGCVHSASSGTCDDGDPCTKNDACTGGVCKGAGGQGCCQKDTDCDDKNACTKDTCNATTGACSNSGTGTDGVACDADGNGCTADVCAAGKCAAGTAVVCQGDACNSAACSSTGASTHTCVKTAKNNGQPCDDGLFCNIGELCNAGTCSGGKPLDCASSGCTTGTCNESLKKCDGTLKPDGTTCNADGNGCTKGDACKSGACVAGAKVDCSNPFDVCNDYTCSSTAADAYQCLPSAKTKGSPCEDGKFCTQSDTCDGAGKCTPGAPYDCSNIADACNDGSCDETTKKCLAKAKSDGATCNDGDSCTGTDTCKAGVCVGSNNSCGDFKISMAKPITAAVAKTAAIVDLGNGRYRIAWASDNATVTSRSYRGDWSREFTEQATVTSTAIIQSVAAIPVGGGSNDILWGFENVNGPASCSTGYYTTCKTSNGCSYYGYYSTASFYNGSRAISAQRFDGNDVASGSAMSVYSDTPGCSSAIQPALSNLDAAGYSDGKRFVAYTVGTSVYRKILNKDGTLFKDLGADATIKNYDIATQSDGTSIFVWDDGAEIWAQMYASTGDTNGTKFQVNTKTTGVQNVPRVAFEPNGRYIIVWQTDQGGGDIAAQVFKSDPGSPLGSEYTVNTTVTSVQNNPHVAVYQDGSFGVFWDDQSAKDGSGWGVLGQWYTATGAKTGGEKVVNAGATGDQRYNNALGLSSDEGVVVWTSLADSHVYSRKFDKAGNPVNGAKEVLVNTTKTNEQADPGIAAGADGSFIVAWDSDLQDGDGAGIVLQRYGTDGSPVGTEINVNTYKTSQQLHPSLGIDSTGKSVVAWDSFNQDSDLEGIYAQRFNADGSKLAGEFAVNQFKTNEQQKPTVGVLPSGKFAVAWESFGQPGGASYDVLMRCYDEQGAAVGNEAIVNTTTTDKQTFPAMAAFPDGSGKYIVVWQSYGEDGSDYGIYAQLLFQDCFKIGNAFQVNTTKTGEQSQPRVAVDKDGNFTVVWRSLGQDGSSYGIYAQTFDKNGAKTGTEFKFNAVTDNEQSRPAVAYLANGNLVGTWQTVGEDETGYAVKQATRAPVTGQIGVDWLGNTTFAGDQNQPLVVGRPDNSWVVVWRSVAQDGDKGGIVARTFK
jgi:hypothetical protein